MKIDVVKPNENFRGMSYSEWAMTWSNWLFSEKPDDYDGGDMLFLRGNVNYSPVGDSNQGPRYIDPKGLYDRTGKNAQRIFEDTAIFIPIITFTLSLNEIYEGVELKGPEQLRYYANIDIDRGSDMWATIMKKGEASPKKIVPNIKDYRMMTSIFRFIVPENSQLKDKADYPVHPGTYDAITVGYFLIIRSLPPSTYRINFGGKGVGSYYTNSVYDVVVHGKRNDTLVDKSSSRSGFKQQWP